MRRVFTVLVVVGALVGLVATDAWAPTASPLHTTIKATVDRHGGILVSGTLACPDVPAMIWGADVPEHVTIGVSRLWTATQPVGRKTSVTATWQSSFVVPCYNTIPENGSACGTLDNPCTWYTANWGSNEPYFVYPVSGKFSPGFITLTQQYEGAYVWVDYGNGPQYLGTLTELFLIRQDTVKATR